MSLITHLFFGLMIFPTELEGRGGHVGNGGDPVEQHFENARLDAIVTLEHFLKNGVTTPRASDYTDVLSFLNSPWESDASIAHAMVEDLKKSPFYFWEDQKDPMPHQPTCARTNVPNGEGGLGTIHFSLKLCQPFVTSEEGKILGTQLLLHEVSHHFGLTQADSEALAIRVGVFLWINATDAQLSSLPKVTLEQRNGEPASLLHTQMVGYGKSSLYLFGGCRSDNLPNPVQCTHYSSQGKLYQIENSRWSEWKVPLSGRAFGALASADEGILVWGGCGKPGVFYCAQPLASGYRFHMPTRTLHDWPVPSFEFEGRVGHSLSLMGNQIVVWGGEGLRGPLSNGAVFDLKMGTWTGLDVPKHPLGSPSRHQHWAAPLGNELLLAGGISQFGEPALPVSLRLRFLEPSLNSRSVWDLPKFLQNSSLDGYLHRRASATTEFLGSYWIWGGVDSRSENLSHLMQVEKPSL